MNKKKRLMPRCDHASSVINKFLLKIPWIGSGLSRFYLWRYKTFNFMIVGASGMILSFLLYEGLLRSLLIGIFGGTFLGMLLTTILVFLWNYFWNKHWSLGIDAQILSMNQKELKSLQAKVNYLLSQKFDDQGERICDDS